MKKISRKILRRLTLVNSFDYTCNMVLYHIFPLATNEKMSRCYEALSYASDDIKSEKKTLKMMRKALLSGETNESDAMIILGGIESHQNLRHTIMQNMIEKKR